MESMDEWITWAMDNKEWAFSGVGVALVLGVVGLVKRVFKKTPQDTVSNTASTGGVVGQTINPQASGGGVAIVQAKTVNVGDTSAIIDKLLAVHGEKIGLEQSVTSLRQQLEEAVVALDAMRQEKDSSDAQSDIDQALEQLSLGEPKEAEAIFRAIVDRTEPDIQKTAEAYRHIGALAFLHDTHKALDAYRDSTRLDPENADGWNRYGRLLVRVGNLSSAESAYNEVIRLGECLDDEGLLAIAYGNLGIVYQTRGELDQAEAMYKKSLDIEEALGRKEGMANQYGNLGILYKARGELDLAEAMYKKSLDIEEALGRKEGMASDYGNLGNVYQIRGDLDQAEAMYKKSLDINEALGRKEGVASDYGNLGIVYKTRGELDLAEAMYKKALDINETLGCKEGLAHQYDNLGILYQTRGELDQAEAMYRKALGINEALGRKEGVADQYNNLGIVYQTRGELDQAESMFEKSLVLFAEIGASPQEKRVQGLLDSLAKEKDVLT